MHFFLQKEEEEEKEKKKIKFKTLKLSEVLENWKLNPFLKLSFLPICNWRDARNSEVAFMKTVYLLLLTRSRMKAKKTLFSRYLLWAFNNSLKG